MALALGANHHHSAVSLDHFALIAHRFYGRSYFHFSFLLDSFFVKARLRFAAPRDSSFRQIIRTHFKLYGVAFDDTDIVHTKLARNVCRDGVTVGKLHFECCVGQRFKHLAFRFDYVVFGHENFLRLIFDRLSFYLSLIVFLLRRDYSVKISTPSSRITTVFS